ncbi:uncharacterized protein B0H18DRAFT_325765 [Fomitopsis serialis]|uniref:uncharacterized protein n=1 Tax=Fomitopsis serialis TaxID=139415 RepID=UPI0020084F90|nr:uncharacterized protein B0H18DRAFT_325765 [Neoantrodia serialis]KAH9936534.1 hypothetical protein B0H18DRAFT_325765 [Neoantrodia serialis]
MYAAPLDLRSIASLRRPWWKTAQVPRIAGEFKDNHAGYPALSTPSCQGTHLPTIMNSPRFAERPNRPLSPLWANQTPARSCHRLWTLEIFPPGVPDGSPEVGRVCAGALCRRRCANVPHWVREVKDERGRDLAV